MGILAPDCWRLDTSGGHAKYRGVQYVPVVIKQRLLACVPVAVGLRMTLMQKGLQMRLQAKATN